VESGPDKKTQKRLDPEQYEFGFEGPGLEPNQNAAGNQAGKHKQHNQTKDSPLKRSPL
jgi:hypothetical protein